MMFDTKPVRSSEQLDWDALDRYVRPKLSSNWVTIEGA
jgi:hypothetical protein